MNTASPLTWPDLDLSTKDPRRTVNNDVMENAENDKETARRSTNTTTQNGEERAKSAVDANALTSSGTSVASHHSGHHHNHHHSKQRKNPHEGNPNLGLKETKAVSCLRLVVLAVLVTSATCTAIAVYYYTRNSEISAFEESYYDDADHVVHGVGMALYVTLGAMDTYIAELIGHANDTGQEWPWVTIHDAPVHLAKLSSTSKAVFMQQSHFVTASQRQEWENYTSSQSDWIDNALQVQYIDPNLQHVSLYFPEEDAAEFSSIHSNQSVIHNFEGSATGAGPFLPTWLSYPILPYLSAFNFDALAYSSVNDSYNELFGAVPRAIISRASTFNDTDYLPSPDHGDDEINATAADEIKKFIATYVSSVLDLHVDHNGAAFDAAPEKLHEIDPLDSIREPFSVINYPILNYDNYSSFFYDNKKESENVGDGNRSPVVGLLTVFFCWRDLIRDILPHSESSGILVVFENQCNQTFTYEVNGPDAIFLGEGDLHDPQYSHMAVGSNVSDLTPYSPMGRFYTGVPLGDGLCPYLMTVYPSAKTESAYATSNPLVFTVCAILIFLFTSAVFLIYDVCVEKRQQKVMDTAIQSSENVSLLEQMVRERTHKLEETNTRLAEANRRVMRASAAQLEHFACMSHEIRTPLNCIIGLSSLLLDTELNGMQEESMRMIVTSGDLLLTVVNDVLDYSKLESGNVEIRIVRSNLQDTLSAVVQSIEARARLKNLAIRTTYDPRIGEYCMMDCRRLQQILYNILGNAVKFSNPNGTINLTVSLIRKDVIKDDDVNGHTYKSKREDEVIRTNSVIVYEDPLKGRTSSFKLVHRGSFANKSATSSDLLSANTDTFISFVIKDCGKGIEKKDFKKIFEPFRQASAETERVYGGTGLGLAVTAKLATGLGGSISVDSCEGEWSEFTVNLPYRDIPFDIERLAFRLSDTSILFVEDDERTKLDVFSMFQKCHLNYFSYNSMNETVAAISESNYLRSNRVYICLVNEALYDETSYRVLADKAPFVLLTFGPKYSVKESKCHYRSLTQVLPSVLVESFVDSIVNVPRPGFDRVTTESDQKKTSAFHRQSGKFAIERPVDIRILIAEDNVINQKVLLRILTRLGYENVDVVDNGQKACDQEEKQYYDIILMDVQMPVMSGIDACQIIMNRTTTNHPKPKVVFVTAHVSDAFETECRNAGGTDFLPKPFNLNDIENCLQRNTSQ